MRERLRIFFLLTVFWLSFMVVARIVFLAYNYDYTETLTFTEQALTVLYGFRMDASMTGYFLMFSGLILTLSVFNNSIWFGRILRWITVVLLFLCSFLIVVDVELYRHWGFRLNTTPLMYISKEAVGSVDPLVSGKLLLLFIVLFFTFLIIFLRKLAPRIRYLGEARPKAAIPLFLLTALMFLPIRGSFTVAPMNTGFVYFHNSKAYANHSAVNVVWNFLYNVRKASKSEYPENFYDREKTNQLFTSLYNVPDSTLSVLHTNRPNIIMIILESFTAGVIEPLGGRAGITPNLNALCREGILFDSIYASGDRTDKGLIAILSGYPAQPQTSIIKFPAKTERLPQLNRFIREMGYRTSFIYGGDIDFANFRSYLNSSGFDHLTTLDDFDDELYTSKWGVHDHHMFKRAMEELDTSRGPFFKVILTLSSHEPFDVPVEPLLQGNDAETLFLNSCHYTDQALGTFVEYCKSMPWWENTLLVITADHGHRHPGDRELHDPARYHIPLLFTGGAVMKDSVNHLIGSQTDIARTLLAQLGKPTTVFTFSKDLLNAKSKPFAPYFFTDGFGFVTSDGHVAYDNAGKRFLDTGNIETLQEIGKAYQQMLYTNYNAIDK